jgi:NAD(P)-dependent dehydrogenase (short-subunit alcohol dehydrogenase family)
LTETRALKVYVRDEGAVKNTVDQALKRFGQIDVLINDAAVVPHFAWGIPRWPRIQDIEKEFWDRVIQTNLGGTFLCTKHVASHMVERKSGHIINLYGGGGLTPFGSCAYVVTKEAIRTFARFVAEEMREANVCVVIFSPRVPIATEGAPEEALVLGAAENFRKRLRSSGANTDGEERRDILIPRRQAGKSGLAVRWYFGNQIGFPGRLRFARPPSRDFESLTSSSIAQ